MSDQQDNTSDEQPQQPKRPIVVEREVQDDEVDYGDDEVDYGEPDEPGSDEPFGEPDYSTYSDLNEEVKPKSKTMAAKKKYIPPLVLTEYSWSTPNDF